MTTASLACPDLPEMEANQLAYLKARYSNMDQEELAVLVATRRHVLSEEAIAALSEVFKERNLPAFVQEVREVVNDLYAQADAARLEFERQRLHKRRARKAMLFFGIFVMALAFVMYLLKPQ